MRNEGHKFVRVDGSTPREARTKAIEALNDDPSIRFIICSLKAAGCGINFTRANVVFMMDPWWNDATEMQAVDRCHRVGQTRPVRVYRMVMKDSIEEQMVTNIQQAKATLGKGAMAHLTADELKMAKIVTLKDLFGIGAANGINELDDEPADWE
jgi:SNF2 family DNA or RNA helicase